jgi:trans-aconitate methyltransferase
VTREQRTVFGEVADDYEQTRPDYPDTLFDAVFEFGGLRAGDRALEIGAGTGKATRGFIMRGLDVLALEPAPGMAAILRKKHQATLETTFEDWTLEPDAFALVYAAQSWHWVEDHDAQYDRVADTLGPRGTVAFFWNLAQPFDGALGEEIAAVYRDIAPDADTITTKWPLDETLTELQRAARFDDVTKETCTWSRTYTTAEYLMLMGTHSSHRMLDEGTLTRLQQAVGAVVDAQGGAVTVDGESALYLAHAR